MSGRTYTERGEERVSPAVPWSPPTETGADEAPAIARREVPDDRWAVVEVMGHRRYVGLVREVTIAGIALIRVHVPEVKEHRVEKRRRDAYDVMLGVVPVAGEYERDHTIRRAAFHVDLGPSSIFAISWCDEAYAVQHSSESHPGAVETVTETGPWRPVAARVAALPGPVAVPGDDEDGETDEGTPPTPTPVERAPARAPDWDAPF